MIETQLIDICDTILASATEDDCDALFNTIRQRTQYLRTQKQMKLKNELSSGDRAILDGLKPKYLNGCRVTIESVTGFKALVRFDRNPRPQRFGDTVTVPLSTLNPIS